MGFPVLTPLAGATFDGALSPNTGRSPRWMACRSPSPVGGSRGCSVRTMQAKTATLNANARRVTQLSSISNNWVMSLKTFKTGKKGWIPDAAARRAAAPYGFLQSGSG